MSLVENCIDINDVKKTFKNYYKIKKYIDIISLKRNDKTNNDIDISNVYNKRKKLRKNNIENNIKNHIKENEGGDWNREIENLCKYNYNPRKESFEIRRQYTKYINHSILYNLHSKTINNENASYYLKHLFTLNNLYKVNEAIKCLKRCIKCARYEKNELYNSNLIYCGESIVKDKYNIYMAEFNTIGSLTENIITDVYIEINKNLFKNIIEKSYAEDDSNFYFNIEVGGKVIYSPYNYTMMNINAANEKEKLIIEENDNTVIMRIPCNVFKFMPSLREHKIMIYMRIPQDYDIIAKREGYYKVKIYSSGYVSLDINKDIKILCNKCGKSKNIDVFYKIFYNSYNQISNIYDHIYNTCICNNEWGNQINYGFSMFYLFNYNDTGFSVSNSRIINIFSPAFVNRIYLIIDMDISNSEDIYIIMDFKYKIKLYKRKIENNDLDKNQKQKNNITHVKNTYELTFHKKTNNSRLYGKYADYFRKGIINLYLPRQYTGNYVIIYDYFSECSINHGMFIRPYDY